MLGMMGNKALNKLLHSDPQLNAPFVAYAIAPAYHKRCVESGSREQSVICEKGNTVDLKFVASVAERDIDFLILEELSVSIEFQEWLSSRIFNEAIYKTEIGAWHSVSEAGLGESDLVFIFSGKDDQRNAILIENKVDAPPQKNKLIVIN